MRELKTVKKEDLINLVKGYLYNCCSHLAAVPDITVEIDSVCVHVTIKQDTSRNGDIIRSDYEKLLSITNSESNEINELKKGIKLHYMYFEISNKTFEFDMFFSHEYNII